MQIPQNALRGHNAPGMRQYPSQPGKRLPAYAKQLVEARLRGVRPWLVIVLFGSDWKAYPSTPKICTSPHEYAPGTFDFGCLTGIPAVVVAYEGGTQEQLVSLCREIAAQKPMRLMVRADGEVFSPHELEGW